MKDYMTLDLMETAVREQLRMAYDEGYSRALKDLTNNRESHKEAYQLGLKEGYENGINEAEAYHLGYDKGYRDGTDKKIENVNEATFETGKARGAEEVWAMVNEIANEITSFELIEILGMSNLYTIVRDLDVHEVMGRVRKYKELQEKERKCKLLGMKCDSEYKCEDCQLYKSYRKGKISIR